MPYTSCQICSSEFYVKPSHQDLGWGKYCSVECRHRAQLSGTYVSCTACNKEIYRSLAQIKHSNSGLFFCTKSCQNAFKNSFRLNENHPNWSGGVRSYRRRLLRSNKKPVCVTCGIREKRVLAAHHIDHNRKNNKLSNLAWVCLNCHHLIHHDKEFEQNFKKRLVLQ